MLRKKDRKGQFEACFEGWRTYVQAPPAVVFKTFEDRCLFRFSLEWKQWADKHMVRADEGIGQHNPLGADHRTAVMGWREPGSLVRTQLILHCLDGKHFFELDFDVGNPSWGLGPLAIHAGEWLRYRLPRLFGKRKKVLDSYWLARRLRNRGIHVEVV